MQHLIEDLSYNQELKSFLLFGAFPLLIPNFANFFVLFLCSKFNLSCIYVQLYFHLTFCCKVLFLYSMATVNKVHYTVY